MTHDEDDSDGELAARRARVARRVDRLRSGNWQFGHDGYHHGAGTPDCPSMRHHHHDDFCEAPTPSELRAAGISPADYRRGSRA